MQGVQKYATKVFYSEKHAIDFKTTLVANIQRTKMTLNKLKTLTKEINIEVTEIVSSDCPF